MSCRGGTLVLVVVCALATACEGPEEVLQTRLAEWDAEVLRNAWSCDAMGHALGGWLDVHGEELSEAISVLAEEAAELSEDERRAFLADLGPGRHRPDLSEARATCSGHPEVREAFGRMTQLLGPILVPLAPEPVVIPSAARP